MQAGTRVNAEQAPKRIDAEADPTVMRGRPPTGWEESDATHRPVSAGVLAPACMEDGKCSNTGSPAGAVARGNRNPARDRPGRQGGGWVRSTGDAG